ncbi:hypothetical protein AcV5_009743 [Taiwanofungus camphoratus]|nr:hypothetical protein AcV5_009743 [Antrodia cinnamomea]
MTGEYEVGPFSTKTGLANWLNGRLRTSQHVMEYGIDCLPFDASEPLVLVDGDISMRNIVLDDEEKVWLIDWGCSGVYLPWFECCSMHVVYNEPWMWTWTRRFAAGWYDTQEQTFHKTHWAMSLGAFVPTNTPDE